jgi:acetyl-CoA acyltransferase
MTDRDAVVVEAVRTAIGIGKPEKGDLNRVHPVNVGSQLIRGLVARTGIAPTLIDEVIWGCVSQVDEQSFNIARNTALAAGLPEAVTGTTVDRQCGSSMQSLQFAAASVLAGHYDVVVAGGVEIMSRVPMFSNAAGADPYGPVNDRYAGRLVPQGISAEMVAERWDLSRAYLDEIALESHARAAKAQANGLFDEEIVPIDTGAGVVTHDQGIRTNTSLERMAVLRPAFKDDGVITVGNSSQISDGAAALLVMTSRKAAELGLTPLARLHAFASCGVDPVLMLTGPIPATSKALNKAGISASDVGAFEVNEAFASVLGAWYAETGISDRLTNPVGGAIALGHPLGASGARLATTLVHHMRREGIRFGLQTMCEGGGMANAIVFELAV